MTCWDGTPTQEEEGRKEENVGIGAENRGWERVEEEYWGDEKR